MIKNKKTIIVAVIVVSVILIIIFFTNSNKSTKPGNFFLNTIPLLNQNNKTKTEETKEVIYPPINPAKTNYEKISSQTDVIVSETEKDKILTDLPIYIDSFVTGTRINTTINVYTLVTDPPQAVRIEIYGPNYNNSGLLSEDAKAFKASFQEIKKYFKTKKVNLNNLQVIYGNRQYIQDTATLWVKEFGLLD